jgi:hypothetical protein
MMLCQLDDEALDFEGVVFAFVQWWNISASAVVGDSGAIGRFVISNDTCKVDLKGRRYDAKLYPTMTCMVVQFTDTEAKVPRNLSCE